MELRMKNVSIKNKRLIKSKGNVAETVIKNLNIILINFS